MSVTTTPVLDIHGGGAVLFNAGQETSATPGPETVSLPAEVTEGQSVGFHQKRSLLVAYVLLFFGGLVGAHRYYLHMPKTGVAWTATLGVVGVGWLADWIFLPWMTIHQNRKYATQVRVWEDEGIIR